jgi:hypothetical protein
MDHEPDDSGIDTDVVAPHLGAQRQPGLGAGWSANPTW